MVDLPAVPQEDGRVLESQNFGSGIVASTDGHILTNFHVVDGAAAVWVVLQTGERRPALIVADDSPFNDIAILVTDPTGLRTASLGDSDRLELGEPLAAITSGVITFENQVKLGVFSARQSTFPREGVLWLDMLQTDAAVNNGDSGDALVNLSGEVVGLLTTVVRQSGGRPVDGVAMAHSSSSIRPLVDAVVSTSVNPRPRIGVERVNSQHLLLSPQLIAALEEETGVPAELPVSDGALIVSVAAGSPAEQAGILPGDVVVGVDGIAVDLDTPFVNLLAFAVVGEELELFVVRGEEQLVIRVVPQLVSGVPS